MVPSLSGTFYIFFGYNGKIPVPGGGGGGLRCLALTSMSRRLLHRRCDMRGEKGMLLGNVVKSEEY